MFQLVRFVRLVFLVFGILSVAQCSNAELPKRDRLPQKWEPIFFKIIDAATVASGNLPLKQKPLASGDLEVRIWRGFSLSPLEGVIIERKQNIWAATHLISDDYVTPTQTVVKRLPEPRRGWPELWERLITLGLVELPGALGEACLDTGRVDGMNYVVEISERGSYRTYTYAASFSTCDGSNRMDLISEIIGIEFHDGLSECKQAEWFPCASILRERRLAMEADINQK